MVGWPFVLPAASTTVERSCELTCELAPMTFDTGLEQALQASSINMVKCRSWTPGLRFTTAPSLITAEFPEVHKPSACACDLKSTPGVTGCSPLLVHPFLAVPPVADHCYRNQLRKAHLPLDEKAGVYNLPQLYVVRHTSFLGPLSSAQAQHGYAG